MATAVSIHRSFFKYKSLSDVAAPLLNGYSEPARNGDPPIAIAAADVSALLNRWVWGRNGE
jgi:hypothetical protein